MNLYELNQDSKTIAIYPGRFQTPHKGHAAVYDQLVKRFGSNNVFIATSDKVELPSSPFNFAEKQELLVAAGIPKSHIIQCRSPYRANEITEKFDPQNTVIIFALGEKDMQGPDARFKFGPKKDGSPSYMQPLEKGVELQSFDKHAYVMELPTVRFSINGQEMTSASELRRLFADSDEHGQQELVKQLYGSVDPKILHLLQSKLAKPSAMESKGGAKVKLYTDPAYFGADVDDSVGNGKPTVDIKLADLVGFEPDAKMKDPKSAANKANMVELIKSGKGKELPPILVRKHGKGYQVLDGHHRFHAYKAAGAKTIPAKVIPADEIEVIDKAPTNEAKCWTGYVKKGTKMKGGVRVNNCVPKESVEENFADGKGPGRKGDSQRHGIPKKATMAQLEKAAKAKGRKGQLARWQLNMRRGKKKANEAGVFAYPAAGFPGDRAVAINPFDRETPKLAEHFPFFGEEKLNEVTNQQIAAFAEDPRLNQFSMGFELEMIWPGLDADQYDDYEEWTEDWDADEDFDSTGDAKDWQRNFTLFFTGGNFPWSRREIQAGIEALQDAYAEWLDGEWQTGYDRDDPQDSDAEVLNAIDRGKSRYPDDDDKALEYAEEIWKADFTDSDGFHLFCQEKGYDTFRDLADWFWRNTDVTTQWPYQESERSRNGGLTGEELAQQATDDLGFKVQFTEYHGVDKKLDRWYLEPDGSIEPEWGYGGVELTSPPLPFPEAIKQMERVFAWAKRNDAQTGKEYNTGFHMNVSLPDMSKVDYVKLILLGGDNKVLHDFDRMVMDPSRTNYAKSSLQQLVRNMRFQKITATAVLDALRKGLASDAAELAKRTAVQGDKYVSVNIKSKYVEFRSAGGDVLNRLEDVKRSAIQFCRAIAIASDPTAEVDLYKKKLAKLMLSIDDGGDPGIKAFQEFAAGKMTKERLVATLTSAAMSRGQNPKAAARFNPTQFTFSRGMTSGNDFTIDAPSLQAAVPKAVKFAEANGLKKHEIYFKPAGGLDMFKVNGALRDENGQSFEFGEITLAIDPNSAVARVASDLKIPKDLAPNLLHAWRLIRGQYGTSLDDLELHVEYMTNDVGKIAAAIKRQQQSTESMDESTVDEVNMSPGALADFAKTPLAKSITVGWEAEMLVPGLDEIGTEYGESEPDWDADERISTGSFDSVRRDVEQFFIGDHNSRGDVRQAMERFSVEFLEWTDDQWNNYDGDAQFFDDMREMIESLASDQDQTLTPEEMEEIIDSKSGDLWEEAYERVQDAYKENLSLEDFMDQEDINYMSVFANRFDLQWPEWTIPESDAFAGLADEFTSATGYPAIGGSSHSDSPDAVRGVFKNDSSIQRLGLGYEYNGVEFASAYRPYDESLDMLNKFFKWAGSIGAEANESCGFHMGVSIPEQTMDNVDHLKFILFLGDKKVLADFGRSSSHWTKSILELLQRKVSTPGTGPTIDGLLDKFKAGINSEATRLARQSLVKAPDRYFTVNIKSNYIEVRSAGGNYFENKDLIINTMNRYVRTLALAADPAAEKQEYAKKVAKLLAPAEIALKTDPKGGTTRTVIKKSFTETMMAFSLFAAGIIDKEKLKSELRFTRFKKDNEKQAANAKKPPVNIGTWSANTRIAYQLIDRQGRAITSATDGTNIADNGLFYAANSDDAARKAAELDRTNGLPMGYTVRPFGMGQQAYRAPTEPGTFTITYLNPDRSRGTIDVDANSRDDAEQQFLSQHPRNYVIVGIEPKIGESLEEMLKKVKGKWALVSRHDPRKVLQYYHGSGHPSKDWVSKVERRVHSFSEGQLDEGMWWRGAGRWFPVRLTNHIFDRKTRPGYPEITQDQITDLLKKAAENRSKIEALPYGSFAIKSAKDGLTIAMHKNDGRDGDEYHAATVAYDLRTGAMQPKIMVEAADEWAEPKLKVYVDMDGVLADFFGEWAKLDGKDHYKDIDNPVAKLQLVRDHPNFWINLPVLPHAKDLVRKVVAEFGEWRVCSKPLEGDPRSAPEKRAWIAAHFQDIPPVEIILTADKAQHATSGARPNLLIDDYGVNVASWRAAGGIAIHYEPARYDEAARVLERFAKM
jgi:5'(3')-deoxyribonucleotidase